MKMYSRTAPKTSQSPKQPIKTSPGYPFPQRPVPSAKGQGAKHKEGGGEPCLPTGTSQPAIPDSFRRVEKLFKTWQKKKIPDSVKLSKNDKDAIGAYISEVDQFSQEYLHYPHYTTQPRALPATQRPVLDKDYEENEALRNQLREYKDQINELLQRERDLTTRNSELMHAVISQDETALENVNSLCRPSHVVERYQALTTDSWLAAKEELDDVFYTHSDKDRSCFLCDILLVAGEVADFAYAKCKEVIGQVVCQPVEATATSQWSHFSLHDPRQTSGAATGLEQHAAYGSHAKSGDGQSLGSALNKAVSSELKTTCPNVRTDLLVEQVLIKMQRHPFTEVAKNRRRSVHAYVQDCCQLAWMMVVQQPPMTFSTEGQGQLPNDNHHDIYFECRRTNKSFISFFMKPALMHGTKCLHKAQVFLSEGEKRESVGRHGPYE